MLLISLGILLYIACFTGYVHASFKNSELKVDTYELVKVKQGDTLWNIADQYNEQFDVSLIKMLDIIFEYNQLTSSTIQPGQTLKIPIR